MQMIVRKLNRLALCTVVICAVVLSVSGRHITDATQEQAKTQTPPASSETKSSTAAPSSDVDELEPLMKSMRKLTTDVEVLRKRVTDLEKDRLFDVTRVLLLREEQRAETLQAKIRETMEKQTILQTKLEQLDQQLRPENIERMFTGMGSVRPDVDREMARRRIVTERVGVAAQIELIRQERARFQASLATADIAIQRLRIRLSEAARP